MAPLSGVSYLRRHDTLVFSLADGSFHVVSQFSTDPRLALTSTDTDLSAEALSTMSRSVFLKAEERQPDRMDVNRVGGMVAFDESSTYAWILEYISLHSYEWYCC